MAEIITLAVTKRAAATKGARKTMRRNGRIPGALYGFEVAPTAVEMDASDILRTYRKSGQSTVIEIDFDGKKTMVLIKQVDLDPVRHEISHVDFHAINMKEKVTVEVPVQFNGEAPAVKNLGGIFVSDHDHVEVRCLPNKIPHHFEIDVSKLINVHDHLTVGDLNLSDDFELVHLTPDVLICTIAGKKAVKEEEDEEDTVAGEAVSEEEAVEKKV